MQIFSLFLISILLSSCNHSPINTKLTDDWRPLTLSKQKRMIRRQTKKQQQYDGLYLLFEAELTFLNKNIQDNNLRIKSQFKNWTPNEALKFKSKKESLLSTHSEFFLTFYSPKTKRNKLDQDISDWKVILKVHNMEYKGTITLRKKISYHNKAYFPELSPWSTPYLITFPISTHSLSTQKFKVVILGPEGMAQFKY